MMFPFLVAPLRGDVRVIRTHLLAGRIEVYVREEWRAVCHSSWDDNDAQVVCRQLGFSDIGIRYSFVLISRVLSIVGGGSPTK